MQTDDFAWLVEHSVELFEKYKGKWIAVGDKQVIGVGDTAPEAAENARRNKPGVPFILEAIEHEADVIYAGL